MSPSTKMNIIAMIFAAMVLATCVGAGYEALNREALLVESLAVKRCNDLEFFRRHPQQCLDLLKEVAEAEFKRCMDGDYLNRNRSGCEKVARRVTAVADVAEREFGGTP